jgi:hypothetical protein
MAKIDFSWVVASLKNHFLDLAQLAFPIGQRQEMSLQS